MNVCRIIIATLSLSAIKYVIFCGATNETVLLQQLFSNYNPQARPAANPSHQVNIDISLYLRTLKELDTKHEMLSVVGWVTASWHDSRLQWNKSEYGGMDYLAVSPTELWIPTFVLGNSASSSLYEEMWYLYFKAKVFHNGLITWSPGGILTVQCTVDVTYFPFDEQICAFRFENWVYTGDKVNLSYPAGSDANLLVNYQQNGIWDIKSVEVVRRDVTYTLPIPYPEVVFGIHFKRKVLYYITNIILLSILIGILVLNIFKLPAESGEKISMGVTLLLAYSVFILMVNENIPEISTAVPIIIIYLLSIMAVTTFSICESVLVLYCYYHSGKNRAPSWIRWIYFGVIASGLRRKGQADYQENHHKNDNSASNYNVNPEIMTTEEIQKEWKALGELIDGITFWIFVIVFIVLIVVLIVIMPYSAQEVNIHTSRKAWAGF